MSLSRVVVAISFALTACGSDTTEPVPETTLDLEGVWLITPSSQGTSMIEFGPDAGGMAELRVENDASGVIGCSETIYAIVNDDVLYFEDQFFVVTSATTDEIELDGEFGAVTLERITGTPPIAACVAATATEVASFDFGIALTPTLQSVGSHLYLNMAGLTDSIVGYDTVGDSLLAAREYDNPVGGVNHSWIIGARSDSLFYGHCNCGISTSVDFFDLDAGTSIASTDVESDLGISMLVQYGVVSDTTFLVGGQAFGGADVHNLVTLHGETLDLISQREILPELGAQDIALRGDDLLALAFGYIVVVGPDGRAESTFRLEGVVEARGLAVIGSTVYVVDAVEANETVLHEVDVP